jgi:CDP-diglyceride synthetase
MPAANPAVTMLALLAKALLGALIGFVVLAVIGGLLVAMLSTNTHDRAQEIPLTAFVCGLAGALLGLIGGIVYGLVRSSG